MTTVTPIGSGQSTVNSTTIDVVTTVAVAAHECIVGVVLNSIGRSVSAISDNGASATTNTYTKAIESIVNCGACIFYCLDSAALASGRTFRVTLNNSNTSKNLFLFKIDGIGTLASSGSGAGSSTTPSATTGASVAANASIFGGASTNGASTVTQPGGDWTGDYGASNNNKAQSIAHGIAVSAGTVTYNPVMSVSNVWDCVVAAFTTLQPINGTASITEADDTGSSASALKLQTTASITEASDTGSSTATLKLQATATITEAGDTSSSIATLKLQAIATPTEAGDTLVAAGLIPPRVADLNSTEANDTSSSTATITSHASAIILEASDSLVSTAAVPLITATLTNNEQSDTVVSIIILRKLATLTITEQSDTIISDMILRNPGALTIDEDSDTLLSASRVRPPQRLPQGPPFDADYGANTDGFYGKYYG